MGNDDLPLKKDVARALLLRGSVFVHLDPRMDGVMVPAWLSNQPQLVLQLGLDMPIPITDLKVDEEGISGTLSFSRTPFTCVVGWDAIFALSGEDGQGMVWPHSMPPEITAEVEREAGRREPLPLSMSEEDLQGAHDAEADMQAAEVFSIGGERLSEAPMAAVTADLSLQVTADAEGDDESPPTQTVRGKPLPPYLRVVK